MRVYIYEIKRSVIVVLVAFFGNIHRLSGIIEIIVHREVDDIEAGCFGIVGFVPTAVLHENIFGGAHFIGLFKAESHIAHRITTFGKHLIVPPRSVGIPLVKQILR